MTRQLTWTQRLVSSSGWGFPHVFSGRSVMSNWTNPPLHPQKEWREDPNGEFKRKVARCVRESQEALWLGVGCDFQGENPDGLIWFRCGGVGNEGPVFVFPQFKELPSEGKTSAKGFCTPCFASQRKLVGFNHLSVNGFCFPQDEPIWEPSQRR